MDLLEDFEVVPAAARYRRGGPLADAVHGENECIFKRRGVKRAGCVALVVFGKKQPVNPIEIFAVALQLILEEAALEQFLAHPERNRHLEGTQPPWRERDVGFQKALELQERLVVKDDIVDGGEIHACEREAELHGMGGKARVMFLAGEALFLRRGDDLSIAKKSRRTVVIERGNAEDAHPSDC